MLSRYDIERELGKGLTIFPLKIENIKENSINLTISQNAWTQGDASFYWYGGEDFRLNAIGNYKKVIDIRQGDSCILSGDAKKKYLILLPHSTSVIETSEVIGVGDYIGGALHSKVGLVAKGVGHIGTMLGPGFCGHLMVSLHNISDGLIILPVGSTFVSLTLDYLKTPVKRTSSTMSGHADKFAELNLKVDDRTTSYLTKDWKSNFDGINDKMEKSDEYKGLQVKLKSASWRKVKNFFNRANIIKALIIVIVIAIIYAVCYAVDRNTSSDIWVERFWNVGMSGILLAFVCWIIRLDV